MKSQNMIKMMLVVAGLISINGLFAADDPEAYDREFFADKVLRRALKSGDEQAIEKAWQREQERLKERREVIKAANDRDKAKSRAFLSAVYKKNIERYKEQSESFEGFVPYAFSVHNTNTTGGTLKSLQGGRLQWLRDKNNLSSPWDNNKNANEGFFAHSIMQKYCWQKSPHYDDSECLKVTSEVGAMIRAGRTMLEHRAQEEIEKRRKKEQKEQGWEQLNRGPSSHTCVDGHGNCR